MTSCIIAHDMQITQGKRRREDDASDNDERHAAKRSRRGEASRKQAAAYHGKANGWSGHLAVLVVNEQSIMSSCFACVQGMFAVE